MTESCYLGVDLGTKRIGFAISGPGGMVSPLDVVPAGSNAAEHAAVVLSMVEEYGPDVVVLGLPLNMDGSEGPQAALTREVAQELRTRSSKLTIVVHDERLTSHAADGMLAGRELTRRQKKARQDAMAAKVLLESYLAAQGEPDG